MKNKLARILVASDDAAEAQAVAARLEQDFDCVGTMASEEADARRFTEFAPDVLLLAVKGISRAEHHLLGLLRSVAARSAACRTILLCGKEEVALAFDLCKKGYFDDYVLYWPIPYDGMRLTMSVWVACQALASTPRAGTPAPGDLIAHVRSLDAVDNVLEASFTAEDRARLEPHMAQARNFADKVRQIRLTVMVVEDDPLACQVIEHILRDQRIDLLFVKNAPAALAAVRRQRPDLILMDIRLPGMDGVALTRALKATPGTADVPILMLTGTAKRETVAASVEAGAAGFLVKPVTREALLTKLQPYLLADKRP